MDNFEYRGYKMPKPAQNGTVNDGGLGYFYSQYEWRVAVDESIHQRALEEYEYLGSASRLYGCKDCGSVIFDPPVHSEICEAKNA